MVVTEIDSLIESVDESVEESVSLLEVAVHNTRPSDNISTVTAPNLPVSL